jgi:hypothetical protein
LSPEDGPSHTQKEFSDRVNPRLPPYRLSVPLREKLAAHLELDPQSVRAAGVTIEVAEKAVSGQDLEPAVGEQLSALLASAPASATSG